MLAQSSFLDFRTIGRMPDSEWKPSAFTHMHGEKCRRKAETRIVLAQSSFRRFWQIGRPPDSAWKRSFMHMHGEKCQSKAEMRIKMLDLGEIREK